MRVFHLSADFVDPHHIVRNVQFHPHGHTLFALIGPVGDVDASGWWSLRDERLQELMTPNDEDDFYWTWTGAIDPIVNADLELFTSVDGSEGGEGTIRVFDRWSKPTREWIFHGPTNTNCDSLAFAPSGALFAALTDAAGNATVMWWDLDEAFENHDSPDIASDPFELESAVRPQALACSPDGATVVVGGDLNELSILDFTLWREKHIRLSDARDVVSKLQFSRDGSLLLMLCGGTVTVWDAVRWRVRATLSGNSALTAAAFSPYDRTLALTSVDGTVSFRDAATFAERARFAWDVGPLHGVAFAPDGLTCAAGGDHGRVVLWDVET